MAEVPEYDRFSCVGKQILLHGEHFADAKDEATACWTVETLNAVELLHPQFAYTTDLAQQRLVLLTKPVCLGCGYVPCRCLTLNPSNIPPPTHRNKNPQGRGPPNRGP